jgi:hypothetical protein
MSMYSNNSKQLNSTLFVDFDNIYINLAAQDRQAAEKFSTNPDRWLTWFEHQLPTGYAGSSFTSRRILLRRCYLNPNSFSEYRPHFIRSAFEVIDCPPLTAQGKTSTDIHMVMDILDALRQETYFHEFIILSGDADFTPVLISLRKHARYSVILSIGYASPAYKSASDYLIKQNIFIQDALGINYVEEEQPLVGDQEIPRSTRDVLKRIGDRIFEAADSPAGVPGNDLPEIYKSFPEFKHSTDWLGFRSLRRLTKEIVDQRSDLIMMEDEDSWYVTRKIYADWLYSSEEKVVPGDSISVPGDFRNELETWIKNLLASSMAAISLGTLAQSILKQFSEQRIGSDWLGAGSFKDLLLQLNLDGLQISPGSIESPGYIFDPTRHTLPVHGQDIEIVIEPPKQELFSSQYPELAPLAKKIHQFTELPFLTPDQYGLLFREIVAEVNENGYQMTRTSRNVRDRCIERGAPIARSHVNFVLTGLYHTGYQLGSHKPESAYELGEETVKNTYNLCRAVQFELGEEEQNQLRTWILSKIEQE